MIDTESKNLQVREKKEMTNPTEHTKPGFVFNPAVDILEKGEEIILLADMPGVKAKDLFIDLRDNVLTIEGGIETSEETGKVNILREYNVGKYYRKFSISEVIDQSKIDAQLKNGVLRLKLPKVEKAAPRKITVKTA
ncbi:MAG: Hsp20/alpha crystallin family protein [Desulfobacterales bacterium]|nr:Hsp20/alpha crystallin family protein [Desulfobacterales bacterium]